MQSDRNPAIHTNGTSAKLATRMPAVGGRTLSLQRCLGAILLATGLWAALDATAQAADNSRTAPSIQAPGGTMPDATAADANSAVVLLYRWWGLFECPVGTNFEPFFQGLFTDDVSIEMPGVSVTGPAQARAVHAAFIAAAGDSQRSHHLTSLEVVDLGGGRFRLNVSFMTQSLPAEGAIRGGSGSYSLILAGTPKGQLRIASLTASAPEPPVDPTFKAAYIDHRARAAIIQFQAVLDRLDGKADDLRELVTDDAVFRGLLAASTSPDVSLDKWDSTLQGHAGLAKWVASGPSMFKSVAHTLEGFTVKPLGGNRYQATAQFDWRAETLAGQKLEKHTPRNWILVDDGGKFMRIAELLE